LGFPEQDFTNATRPEQDTVLTGSLIEQRKRSMAPFDLMERVRGSRGRFAIC
jgi:hypothetical protein